MFKQPFKNKNLPLNGLQYIQQNLNQQRRLLQVVQACLTTDLAAHCVHIIANKNNITLFTDSSVWASKLLYLRQTILKALFEHLGERVHNLKVKVVSKHMVKNKLLPKSPSVNALRLLNEANQSMPTDSLSISMSKLIKTLQKNKLTS